MMVLYSCSIWMYRFFSTSIFGIPLANVDDGSCIPVVLDVRSSTDNYDVTATIDNGFTCCNISNSVRASNPSNFNSCDGWHLQS